MNSNNDTLNQHILKYHDIACKRILRSDTILSKAENKPENIGI
jgi:hypothetical protein